MKHSILCCAVTGALASGAAFAADTQIYGVIDTGFSVRNLQVVKRPLKAQKRSRHFS